MLNGIIKVIYVVCSILFVIFFGLNIWGGTVVRKKSVEVNALQRTVQEGLQAKPVFDNLVTQIGYAGAAGDAKMIEILKKNNLSVEVEVAGQKKRVP
jgi:hypothetical protein